jgi:HK97 family phage portal protein
VIREALANWGRLWSPRPSESDLGGQIQWAVDRRLGAADYLSIPAVGRARSLIVSLVAELEPVAWSNGYPLAKQPRIAQRPQPDSTRDAFLGQIAGSLFDRSNAFLWLPETGRNAEGYPDVAVVLPFEQVQVSWDDSGLFRRYHWGERELIAGRSILHIELPGREPGQLLVPSKLDTNAEALDRILAAELYASEWFLNGGIPPYALKYAGDLNEDRAKAAKTQWLANRSAHEPAVLGNGWDLTATGGDPSTAQLLETRRNGVLECARIWGIVPAELLLAELGGTSLTYQNIAQMLDTFMRVTGQPEYLSPIEAGLSDLVPSTQAIRFDTSELFRLAEAERIHVGAEAITSGIYTLPEVRRSFGLPVESAPAIPPSLASTPPAPAIPAEVPAHV